MESATQPAARPFVSKGHGEAWKTIKSGLSKPFPQRSSVTTFRGPDVERQFVTNEQGVQTLVLFMSPEQSRIIARYKAGQDEKMHTHTGTVEIYVLEGEAEAIGTSKADVRFPMPKGAYWVCPGGVPHSIRAITDCTFLVMLSGAPFDWLSHY